MAFATTGDVAARYPGELTADQLQQAEYVISIVTGLIATAVGRDAAWAAALSPVPSELKALCVEKAVGVIDSTNLDSTSETLGAYSFTERFARDQNGHSAIFLTDDEARAVRFAVFGRSSDSVTIGSIFRSG